LELVERGMTQCPDFLKRQIYDKVMAAVDGVDNAHSVSTLIAVLEKECLPYRTFEGSN